MVNQSIRLMHWATTYSRVTRFFIRMNDMIMHPNICSEKKKKKERRNIPLLLQTISWDNLSTDSFASSKFWSNVSKLFSAPSNCSLIRPRTSAFSARASNITYHTIHEKSYDYPNHCFQQLDEKRENEKAKRSKVSFQWFHKPFSLVCFFILSLLIWAISSSTFAEI